MYPCLGISSRCATLCTGDGTLLAQRYCCERVVNKERFWLAKSGITLLFLFWNPNGEKGGVTVTAAVDQTGDQLMVTWW